MKSYLHFCNYCNGYTGHGPECWRPRETRVPPINGQPSYRWEANPRTSSISGQLSARWCKNHPPVDGDDRTPLEVYEAGLLTQEEFWSLVTRDLESSLQTLAAHTPSARVWF